MNEEGSLNDPTVGPQQIQISFQRVSGRSPGRPGCQHKKPVKYCLFPSGPFIYFENWPITNYT